MEGNKGKVGLVGGGGIPGGPDGLGWQAGGYTHGAGAAH